MAWRFALRLGGASAAALAVVAFLVDYVQAVTYSDLAAGSVNQQAWIVLPPVVSVDTVGGYVQWTGYGLLAVIVSLWAVSAATRATRGDEDRGLVGAALAGGVGRADLLLWRFLAFASYTMYVAGAAALGFVAGAARAHGDVQPLAVVEASAMLVALALACYSIAMLVSQLTGSRTATFASVSLLTALFLLNRLAPVFDWMREWSRLSPYRYYEASQPLATGGAFDARALEVLLGIAVVCGLVATFAFEHRDVGAPLWRPRLPALPGLVERVLPAALWSAAMILLAVLLTATTAQVVRQTPVEGFVGNVFYRDVFPALLGIILFGFAQLVAAGLAFAEVARWAADDRTGRVEIVLATSASRVLLVGKRALSFVITALVAFAPAGLAAGLEAHREGFALNAAHLTAATLLLVPVATAFAAAGAVVVSAAPRAATSFVGAVLLAAYVITFLASTAPWPVWISNLTPFHLYGTPLTEAVDARGLVALTALSVAGFAAAAFLLQRRDARA